jgi:gliding motility-associated-like protein
MNYRILLSVTLLFIFINFKCQSFGGLTSGSASYCAGNNSGFISLNGYIGSIQYWESSEDLVIWNNIGNPTASQSYNNLTVTTHYRAIVKDGAFPQDTSTVSTVTIFIPADGGSLIGGGTFCNQSGAGLLTITGFTGSIIDWEFSNDGELTWNTIGNTSNTYNFPNTFQNTAYRVIVENISGCPYDTSTIEYIVIDSFSDAGMISNDTNVCINSNEGEIVLSGYNGLITNWMSSTDGANFVDFTNTSNVNNFNDLTVTTYYRAIVQNDVCPPDTSNNSIVNVVQLPIVDAGPNQSIYRHQEATLNGLGVGTPYWTPNETVVNNGSLSVGVTPIITTTYYLTITDQNGCSSSDSVLVVVRLPMPNMITPNGDDVNDFLEIEGLDNSNSNSLKIFNRQGQLVYQSSPYNNNWYGTNSNNQDLVDGAYFYELIIDSNEPLTGFIIIKR